MIAKCAIITYNRNQTVDVGFSDNYEDQTISFKRKRFWNHKRYIQKAVKQANNMKLSNDFEYSIETESSDGSYMLQHIRS